MFKYINHIKITLITAGICLAATNSFAQTNVGDEDVDVVSGYNPVLADAVKENFSAALPENKSKPNHRNMIFQLSFIRFLISRLRLNQYVCPTLNRKPLKMFL